jgi:hypothetical protein
MQVCLSMEAAHPDSFKPQLPQGYASAAEPYHRPPVRGVQFHHAVPEAADGSAEVGKDYRHMSADLQVTDCLSSFPGCAAVLLVCFLFWGQCGDVVSVLIGWVRCAVPPCSA